MAKALLLYGSTTGNTAAAANFIKNYLEKENIKTTVSDVASSNALTLLLEQAYDLLLIGCSSWGMEKEEIQEDMENFLHTIQEIPHKDFLKNKPVAIFGCGDQQYKFFCSAVDLMESILKNDGCFILTEAMKIADPWEERKQQIIAWIQKLTTQFQNIHL